MLFFAWISFPTFSFTLVLQTEIIDIIIGMLFFAWTSFPAFSFTLVLQTEITNIITGMLLKSMQLHAWVMFLW